MQNSDARNAFGSIEKEHFKADAQGRYCKQDVECVEMHYTNGAMTFEDSITKEWVDALPGSGACMGHVLAADGFINIYTPKVEEWTRSRSTQRRNGWR